MDITIYELRSVVDECNKLSDDDELNADDLESAAGGIGFLAVAAAFAVGAKISGGIRKWWNKRRR